MARLTILIICVAFLYVSNNVDSQGIGVKVDTTLSKQIENKLENTTSYKYLTKEEKKEVKNDEKKDNQNKELTKTVVDQKKDDKKDEKKDNQNKELTKSVLDAPKQESKSRVARQANLPAIKTITIAYQLGKRVNGDRLLAYTSVNQQWTAEQNVTQFLTYPRAGTGGTVSFVEVIVDQTSNLGSASATAGGVGQRSVSIVVEAQKTLQYRSTASIYGQ